jgi:hypothetical protein
LYTNNNPFFCNPVFGLPSEGQPCHRAMAEGYCVVPLNTQRTMWMPAVYRRRDRWAGTMRRFAILDGGITPDDDHAGGQSIAESMLGRIINQSDQPRGPSADPRLTGA